MVRWRFENLKTGLLKNENPPKSLTTGDNQLSIVGFNLVQRYSLSIAKFCIAESVRGK